MKPNRSCSRGRQVWHCRLPQFSFLALCLMLAFAIPSAAQSCDLTVTSLADDGTSGTLRAELAAATAGANICFGVQGTITLTPTNGSLVISQAVTITGSSAVTISGNNQVQIFVVQTGQSAYSASISGLTLTGGFGTVNQAGGAISVQGGTTLTLTGVTVTGNSAGSGGGIYNGGTIAITNSTISANNANNLTFGWGGGLYNDYQSTMTLGNTTVTNNSTVANGEGGGIYNDGTLQITGGLFTQNQAYQGGAIYADIDGQLNINVPAAGGTGFAGGATFSANTVTGDAGALYNAGTATIRTALFTGNQSNLVGDGVYSCGGAICNTGFVYIYESTIAGNTTTGYGGGIDDSNSLSLNEVTISVNYSPYPGTGVYSSVIEGGPSVYNTIIAGNNQIIDSSSGSDYSGSASGFGTGNLIGGTVELGPLANNGGPTQTMMPLPGGVAIGAGNASAAGGDFPETVDQRGFSRFDPNGGIDAGAVQSHYSSVSFLTQPPNVDLNTVLAPPVAVQVVEVDGSTTNYPQGVPVTLSLLTAQGGATSGVLQGTLTQNPTVSNGVTAAVFPDLSVNAAGTYVLQASTSVVPTETQAYLATSNSFQAPYDVVIQWQPSPLIYGPMPPTELNATATVNGSAATGTFVYTFAGGAIINVGQVYPAALYAVQVAFTPTGTTTPYTLTTALQINPATTALSWSAPAAITYGTGLSAAQLNASSGGIAGTFTYSPAAGTILTVGTHQLSVTFTPTDGTDYTSATAGVSLTVNQATPSLTWATPPAITYGTTLSAAQLNASAGGVAGTFTYTPAAGTILTAGAHPLSVTFTPTDSTDYTTATAAVSLTVNQATPSLTWATPAAITYGTALSAAQLNASSGGIAGTFTYSPAAGTILTAGAHPLSVTFTPTDSTDYTTATATVSLTVNQVTPILTWATPAAITYGTALSAAQLNASSGGIAGTLTYSPAAGTILTAGAHPLSVTFTPTDSTDYATSTATVNITVNKATPALSWSAPASIIYGTALSAAQLNASSGGIAGTFTYSPAAGTILTAGAHPLSVTFTPTDSTDYATSTATVSITVNKATPGLTWATPAAITYGTALSAAQLNASSGGIAGTFTYSPAAGTILTAGAQLLSVTFTPTDSTDYTTATARVSLTVNKATPSLTWATPPAINYGTALSAAQLNASSGGVAGTFTYNPAAGTILTAGAQLLSVTFAPTDSTDYTTATARVSLTVNKATPGLTWATPAAITYGTALSAAQLNASSGSIAGTFTYSPAAGAILTAGAHPLSVTFTPTDSTDYATSTTTVNITVNKATPSLTWATPPAITYGTALSAAQLNASSGGIAGTFTYSPAAGTILTAGAHPLSVTFTPTDSTDYASSTATANITVNKAAPALTWSTPAAIVYGTALSASQLNASPGSVAGTFTYSPAAGAILTTGAHQLSVTFAPTDTTDYTTATATVNLTVNQATPALTWPTPAGIYTLTPLSATQLDATATGVNGAALAGAFVYNPAAGTMLSAGARTLTTTFTPTDTANYTTATAQVTIQVGYSPISITSVSPSTTPLGTSPLSISVTGAGFTSTAVVQLDGSALATTVESATALTATIPAAKLGTAGTFNLSVNDPTSKLTSNIVHFTITAPSPSVTISIPSTNGSGEQPGITINLTSPYPTDLSGTLTLTFVPSGNNGVDDPAIQFSTGGRTLNFTVPAGSTTTPQIGFQTGTVAGTITVTLTLTAGGVDVTPAGLAPIIIVISPAGPVITSVSFTNSSAGLITVVINGFSNTRDMLQAEFVFTGSDAGSLSTPKVDVSATDLFASWFGSPASDQYGSAFTYTQTFQLGSPDSGITGVSVTLANLIGTSGSVNSQ